MKIDTHMRVTGPVFHSKKECYDWGNRMQELFTYRVHTSVVPSKTFAVRGDVVRRTRYYYIPTISPFYDVYGTYPEVSWREL